MIELDFILNDTLLFLTAEYYTHEFTLQNMGEKLHLFYYNETIDSS